MDTYEELENMSVSPQPTPRDTNGIVAWQSSGTITQSNFLGISKSTNPQKKLVIQSSPVKKLTFRTNKNPQQTVSNVKKYVQGSQPSQKIAKKTVQLTSQRLYSARPSSKSITERTIEQRKMLSQPINFKLEDDKTLMIKP